MTMSAASLKLSSVVFLLQHGALRACTQVSSNNTRLSGQGEGDPASPHVPLDFTSPLSLGSRVALTAGYCFIFLLSVVGNVLVLHVMRKNRSLHNATNTYISNLACADLLLALLTFPDQTSRLYNGRKWFEGGVGVALCKITALSRTTAYTISINTLLLIAVTRYFLVTRPHAQPFTAKHLRKFLFLLCVFALASATTSFRFYQVRRFGDGCFYCYYASDPKNALPLTMHFILGFSLPIIILIVLYSLMARKIWTNNRVMGSLERSMAINRHVIITMVAVVTTFAACWAPFQIRTLYVDHLSTSTSASMETSRIYTVWLANSCSAWNPWLYAIFHKGFQEQLKKTSLYKCIVRRNEVIPDQHARDARAQMQNQVHTIPDQF